uniref:Uncharacterized protein n=1 Tax=Apteryx owenii TaxID=8824 RepID=A0A8B9QBC4_APTOW
MLPDSRPLRYGMGAPESSLRMPRWGGAEHGTQAQGLVAESLASPKRGHSSGSWRSSVILFALAHVSEAEIHLCARFSHEPFALPLPALRAGTQR